MQIFRVHFFHSSSLITGHALFSIFLLLASCTLHFQTSCGRGNADLSCSGKVFVHVFGAESVLATPPLRLFNGCYLVVRSDDRVVDASHISLVALPMGHSIIRPFIYASEVCSDICSAGAGGRRSLTKEWKATRHFLVTVVFHCLVALLLSLLTSWASREFLVSFPCKLLSCFCAIGISESSLWTLLVPTSSWIELERRGDLGSTWMGSSQSSLVSLMPYCLLNFIYALLDPIVLYCVADCHIPLAMACRGLSRLSGWWRGWQRCRSCCESRAYAASFYITLACICVSFIFHDGAAFLVIALALLVNCGSVLTRVGVNDEMEWRVASVDERSHVLVAIQLRFALLLVFCSFLSVEQWFTFAFRAKLLFAGHGVDWMRFFSPSVFQFFLLLTMSLLLRSLPTAVILIKGHRYRRLPSLFLGSALFGTLVGCLVCLGGYLHTADNLHTCLVITLVTAFLLGVWLWVATTPGGGAAAVSLGQDRLRLVIALLPSRCLNGFAIVTFVLLFFIKNCFKCV
ncbi:unnamed protein product [Hydatigera taeniaeformis]|uniref:Uncharacterized protein n=1 Tax=Hydatigena taeniaeformis TaxID=6205 RepID=A0A3P7HBC3_HYDTA|nr:unnamed protein product [Hydatigera taeniaeformis]